MTRDGSSGTVSVYRATAVIAGVTALSRVLTAAREILVAHDFGASIDVDAIVVAGVLPASIAGVTIAAVSAAVVPRLIAAEADLGAAHARRMADRVAAIVAGVGALVSLLIAVTAPVVVDVFGLDGAARSIAVPAVRYIAPSIGFAAVSAVWSSSLLAAKRYLESAIGLIVTPLLGLGAIHWLAPTHGIIVLAWAVLVGSAVECGLVACLVHRRHPGSVDRHGRLDTTAREAPWRSAAMASRAIAPPMLSIGLVSVGIIADQYFAARLGPRSVALLAFGTRLSTLLVVLGATSLGMAALPHFSTLVQTERWHDIRSQLGAHRRVVLAGSIVVIAIITLASDLVIRTVFGHGRFSADDVANAADIQRLAVLQLPFYALWFLSSRLASALGRTRIQVIVSVAGLATNITLDWLLSEWFGLPGVALASTGFQLVLCVGTFDIVNRELRRRLTTMVDPPSSTTQVPVGVAA